jgi:hypothetical protein
MSIAHRQVEVVARAEGRRQTAHVAVRWRIASGALTPGARGCATVEILVERDADGTVRVESALVTTDARRVVRTHGPLDARVWWTDGCGLEHIEAAPTLRATLRTGDGETPIVLFAQTDVLAELGVAGGRSDRPI